MPGLSCPMWFLLSPSLLLSGFSHPTHQLLGLPCPLSLLFPSVTHNSGPKHSSKLLQGKNKNTKKNQPRLSHYLSLHRLKTKKKNLTNTSRYILPWKSRQKSFFIKTFIVLFLYLTCQTSFDNFFSEIYIFLKQIGPHKWFFEKVILPKIGRSWLKFGF